MLGDGKLSHFQVSVTLGNKEFQYALYVRELINTLFNATPKIIEDIEKGYRIVYLGSVEVSSWLKNEGLVYNKVKSQVDIPPWIFNKESYMKAVVRGFFDTDLSVYKLKYGKQLSFTNYSLPLLMSLQWLLRRLGYKVSEISGPRFYITKKADIERFFKEIHPMNSRHIQRFELFKND